MKEDKISFEDICNPEFRRKEQMKVKSEAVWLTFLELDGIINVSKFAKRYFNKSQSWFAQRVNGYDVNHKKAEFSTEDYSRISSSLRDLATELNKYADIIENAE
ncbi:MAG: DUF5053 domain-containing protein [Muribaculaceae bacterium]|nr:DUF5053 domain-containing protein [Muribaculaceae bacterium]